MRDSLAIAQHEAAHVVVGAALGLRLRHVTIVETKRDGILLDGCAVFDGRCGSVEAWALMFAAGLVWERKQGDVGYAWIDRARMRAQGAHTDAAVFAYEHAAWCVLMRAADTHARVTRALLSEHELTRADLAEMLRFELV
jgi:hypothetical protein